MSLILGVIGWGIVAAITAYGLMTANKSANEYNATTPPRTR